MKISTHSTRTEFTRADLNILTLRESLWRGSSTTMLSAKKKKKKKKKMAQKKYMWTTQCLKDEHLKKRGKKHKWEKESKQLHPINFTK